MHDAGPFKKCCSPPPSPHPRNLLDSENVALRSRDLSKVLEDEVDGYEVPRPVLRTTYVDDGMRIDRKSVV